MSDATQIALTAETLEAIITQTVAVLKGVDGRLSPSREAQDMPSAWIKQRADQVRDMGEHEAPHYVYWMEGGVQRSKSCGKGADGFKLAQRFKAKKEAELLLGVNEENTNKTWKEFRTEYERTTVPGLAMPTQSVILASLDVFERIVQPGRMVTIKTLTIDQFKRARLAEKSHRRPGENVSPATVNRELRHLKAALKKALAWKYLREMPEIAFLREPKRLPAVLPPEHFAALYQACAKMDRPIGLPYPASDWWRGLLVTLIMTGWRIGATLALRREDVDLVTGHVLTRAEDTKGKRDQRIPVHPAVVEHWRRLPGFSEELFPWPYTARKVYVELHRLCELAGVPRCSFHAFKKTFCTVNASRIQRWAMGVFAQHETPATTDKWYINPNTELAAEVLKLFVPEVLRTGTGG